MLLLIDNFDSFSHNLARYFVELGCDVKIVRNDELSLQEIRPDVVSGIVISPGPCTPDKAGITLEVILQFAGRIPIFGVCLGHQAIGQVFGAKVIKAQQIRHGKVSTVTHNGDSLFDGIPRNFQATRYHSLVLDPNSIPVCLQPLAWSQDCNTMEIMALRHSEMPIWSVQYHPESLLTEFGHKILKNFLILANIQNVRC